MFLYKIDSISPKITLYYFGNKKHYNIFSGIIGLINCLATLSFSVYFFLEFFQKRNPTSYYYNRYVKDAGLYPLNHTSLFHFITFEKTILDLNSVTIIGISSFTSNPQENLSTFRHWIYDNCTKRDLELMKNTVENKDKFLNGFCVNKIWSVEDQRYYTQGEEKFKYPHLRYGASSPKNEYYNIIVEICRDDVPFRKAHCSEPQSTKEILTDQGIELNFMEHVIDIGRFSNPIETTIYTIVDKLFSDSFTKNHLNFNPAIVRTHSGMLFEEVTEEKTFVFSQNEKVTTINKDTKILCEFLFSMQNRLQVYERTYIRIQDVLANIGGVSRIIFGLAIFIDSFFHKFIVLEDTRKLCSTILSKEENKKKKVPIKTLMTHKIIAEMNIPQLNITNKNCESIGSLNFYSTNKEIYTSQKWFRKITLLDYIKKAFCVSSKNKKNLFYVHICNLRKDYLNEEFLCRLFLEKHFRKNLKEREECQELQNLRDSIQSFYSKPQVLNIN